MIVWREVARGGASPESAHRRRRYFFFAAFFFAFFLPAFFFVARFFLAIGMTSLRVEALSETLVDVGGTSATWVIFTFIGFIWKVS